MDLAGADLLPAVRRRPMKTAEWWLAAILLVGIFGPGATGRPDKEGFGSQPYRPLVKFRHKDGIPESLRVKGFMGHSSYPGPCEHKYCGLGRHCVVNHETDQGECRCLDHCKPHYKPVCGSDGKLYQNHCELHRASCLRGHRITIMHSEECFYKAPWQAIMLFPSVINKIDDDNDDQPHPPPAINVLGHLLHVLFPVEDLRKY